MQKKEGPGLPFLRRADSAPPFREGRAQLTSAAATRPSVQVAVVDVEPGQQGRQHASMFNSSEADEAGVFTSPVINRAGPAKGVPAPKTPVAGKVRRDRALMPIIFFHA
jgi:hypothetical protein